MGSIRTRSLLAVGVISLLALLVAACGGDNNGNGGNGGNGGGNGEPSLSGDVAIDGSSTVYPVTEAMQEEFRSVAPDVRITVGISGTGGGFSRFCRGETDISDASRPIKDDEAAICEENGIEFIELPVAYDGLAVMVNPENDFVDCLTVDELTTIWAPESEGVITNWNQVRDSFPDRPLSLYGAGTDSGTYDYFVEVIADGDSRGDFQASEDDNVLVQGIATDANSIGFFGLAYYEENADRLKLVGVDDENPDNGDGCIEPNTETVEGGTYRPLSRPIFIYVKESSADRPEVEAFVDFYLDSENARELVAEVGYIGFPAEIYDMIAERFGNRTTGTVFAGAPQTATIAEVLQQ
ncbi:MAG: PstS family phosphate ABC transporter substrate-binding protein [Dehalococcoidia bacterium]